MNLFDVIMDPAEQSVDRSKRYGVVVGVVTNNQDPKKLGRVKVKFPWLTDEDESAWARIATLMAGNARGSFFLPEVNDEVLIAFDHGDVHFPYVIGALWNGKDKPPHDNADGKNNFRTIKSRSGHIIRLDDTNDKGKIEIIDSSGKNSVVISTDDNTITIKADKDINIESSTGKLILKGNGIEIESKAGIKVKANANMDLESSAMLTAKGSMINLN